MNGRFYSYLNTAEVLINLYDGSLPFHHFIRQYFREHSKYGSRDRKSIAALCYAYFRLGNMFRGADVKQKILFAIFLIQDSPSPLLAALRPDWPALSDAPLEQRIEFLKYEGIQVDFNMLFPLQDKLTSHLSDPVGFASSHLEQPRLFLRIRPGYEDIVPEKLFRAGVPYNKLEQIIELANGTDIENILNIDNEVVVQDMSSQRVGEIMREIRDSLPKQADVWDACAASGGKTILLYDIQPTINLLASDIRDSILDNLKKRLAIAGLHNYQAIVADLRKAAPSIKPQDLIMVDVPCTGSGTWGRTPENLLFISEQQLENYVQLQRKILDNTIPLVKEGGHFLYMTCSVYASENEEQVNYISTKGLQLKKAILFEGWQHHADSLFAAWFTR